MTASEFSNEFDILYNNIMSNQAPGLDEYEKSVFLTKALDEIVKSYFNPITNKLMEGLDTGRKRQADFSSIINTSEAELVVDENNGKPIKGTFDRRSLVYNPPDDIFIVINETISCYGGSGSGYHDYTVMPISYAEYSVLMQKPYKYPLKNQAWRLITSPTTYEIIGKFENNDDPGSMSYIIRYVKKPYPIILERLTGSLTINGQLQPLGSDTVCELPEEVQPEVLLRAIELAKAAYTGDVENQFNVGAQSATDKGILRANG